MIWVIHPTGNGFVRAVLAALELRKADYRFWTSLGWSQESRLLAKLPGRLRAEVGRRSYAIPRSRMEVRPWRELWRLAASGLKLESLARHESGWASVDAVYQDLDQLVAKRLRAEAPQALPEVLLGYEDGCRESFRAARERGVRCVYELPIAYWETSRRLLEEEAERLPEWEPTLVGTRDSAAKLQRKTEELALADAVICPSAFVLRSLPEAVRETKRCVVAEFGTPAVAKVERPTGTGRLRVLFAGSMTQRKGLADVFAALRFLDRADVELVVMGSPVVPMDFYRKQYQAFRYEPTRPHEGVLALMRECDVLVLPSIVEGRALVQQEAMACGLPLIVTANAGGEDLVIEGVTGFLVPIRAPERIAEKLAWCAEHRTELAEMGRAARAHARSYSWERYAGKVLAVAAVECDSISP